jgi:hypothetical protein
VSPEERFAEIAAKGGTIWMGEGVWQALQHHITTIKVDGTFSINGIPVRLSKALPPNTMVASNYCWLDEVPDRKFLDWGTEGDAYRAGGAQ